RVEPALQNANDFNAATAKPEPFTAQHLDRTHRKKRVGRQCSQFNGSGFIALGLDSGQRRLEIVEIDALQRLLHVQFSLLAVEAWPVPIEHAKSRVRVLL